MRPDARATLLEACRTCPRGCALERLMNVTPVVHGTNSLTTMAKRVLGLTHSEAWGIMDGWDSLAYGVRYSSELADFDREEYDAGHALGVECFHAATQESHP